MAFTINKILRVPVKIPRVWQKSEQNKFVAKHLLDFEGDSGLARIIHIHGRHDAIFPIKKIKDVDIIVESGHFVLDKKRRATLAAISQAVQI